MEKQEATYQPHYKQYLRLGERAWVLCVAHQREELSNNWVSTSGVKHINADGSFETHNTIYKPV